MRAEALLVALVLLSACGGPVIILGGDTGGSDVGGGVGGDTDDTDDTSPPAEGVCGLQVTGTPDWLVEGETLRLELACTGDLAIEDAELGVQGAPPGAELEDAELVWETDGQDAGTYEFLLTARPARSDGQPETHLVSLTVYNDDDARNDEPPDPLRYTEEFGLPVMHIDVQGSLSGSYAGATVWFQGKEYAAQAKIRGATSAYYSKPGYMLEFDEDELDIPGWDSDDRDHLALVSTFDDNSYVRQKLTYDQWAAIAEYWGEPRLTPRTFYVVVYLDEKYHGLFMGLDRVDNEFIRHMGFDDTGNLYKAVNHNANFYLTDYYGTPKSDLATGYEKKEGSPEGDYSDLQALVQWTGSATDQALVDGAADHFSLQEWMDWYLLVHYSLSEDSAGKNSYLYHEPTLDQWLYVPWDFNHAWGQNWYTLRLSASALNTHQSSNRVFKAIQKVPGADAELWERFAAMRRDGPFAPDWITGKLDEYYAAIDLSAQRDWDRWGDAYRSYSSWSSTRSAYGDWTDYEGEKAYVYAWVEDRAALFEANHPE